jgi:hypothetical protein
VIVETQDGLEPVSNAATDGVCHPRLGTKSDDVQNPVPWIPALKSDTLHPSSQELSGDDRECAEKHEPLLHVKALETGIIDVSSYYPEDLEL